MDEIIIFGSIFIGLPWLILHYVTKWKTANNSTPVDENLLEELHALAQRLEARMDTVERLVAADHPEYRTARIQADRAIDDAPLRELDELFALEKGGQR